MKISVDDLSDDAEQDFLTLESRFRDHCDERISLAERNDWSQTEYWLAYMRRTSAAAYELGMSFANELEVPAAINLDLAAFNEFRGLVDHFRTTLEIRIGRRLRSLSVKLDEKTRLKLTHYITRIREVILKLEVDDWKRDALLASLNRLQHEVDTSRTGAQALGAFFIEATGTLGEGFEKLEPARKWLDSIAAVLWGVRQNERSKLPAPTETKQIPPPRKKEKPKRGELDDDIPF